MRVLLIFMALVCALAVLLYAKRSSLDAQSDLRAGIALCADCHGKVGHSTASYIPNLAGQNLEYLLNQLQRFANLPRSAFVDGATRKSVIPNSEGTGRRQSDLMKQHTDGIPGTVLREVAAYYSKLPCVQADKAKATSAQPTGVPWCADCHAPRKAQSIPTIPYIYGQNADYLQAQLLAFKRSNSAPGNSGSDSRSHHFMDRSIRDIPDERLHEMAQYYSELKCSE